MIFERALIYSFYTPYSICLRMVVIIGLKYGPRSWAISCFLLLWVGFLRWYRMGIHGFQIRGPHKGPMASIFGIRRSQALVYGTSLVALGKYS